MQKKAFILILLPLITLSSCIGASYDIQINRNGSGRITMEYRISNMLESLGSLDGNKSMPVIPAGREDWQRTLDRVPGTKLVSHSIRENANDTVISVTIDFSTPQALAAIIEPQESGKVSVIQNDQSGSFSFIIYNEPDNIYDGNLLTLMRAQFNDYNFSINFRAPGNSSMNITDGKGNVITAPSGSAAVTSGRNVSLTIGVMDLIDLPEGLGVKINW
ncbi:MAG: hypothetical protein LBG94_01020 [Treponema sp.]|jgi:hypothetical protein|nr:hypothetical protein [Treponema sp.]